MAFIYCIKNIETNKYYIGESLHFEERRKRHLEDLRNNAHHSHKLQYAFNKYGESSFVFQVIEEVSDDIRFDKEREYIIKYDSYINGYNETTGGDNPGYEKLQKPVYCYDYDGQYLNKFFMSCREASRCLDIDYGLVQKIACGKKKVLMVMMEFVIVLVISYVKICQY